MEELKILGEYKAEVSVFNVLLEKYVYVSMYTLYTVWIYYVYIMYI